MQSHFIDILWSYGGPCGIYASCHPKVTLLQPAFWQTVETDIHRRPIGPPPMPRLCKTVNRNFWRWPNERIQKYIKKQKKKPKLAEPISKPSAEPNTATAAFLAVEPATYVRDRTPCALLRPASKPASLLHVPSRAGATVMSPAGARSASLLPPEYNHVFRGIHVLLAGIGIVLAPLVRETERYSASPALPPEGRDHLGPCHVPTERG